MTFKGIMHFSYDTKINWIYNNKKKTNQEK